MAKQPSKPVKKIVTAPQVKENKPSEGDKERIDTKREAPKNTGVNFQNWVIMGVLALFSFIVFSQAFGNDFVDWDDYVYVKDNVFIQNPDINSLIQLWKTPVSLNYHPLTMTTIWLNAVMGNPQTASSFIVTNTILHVLNVLLVFILAMRWSKDSVLVGLGVALLWAVHPMRVESVSWVSERKDVLYVFFFLCGLWTYQRYIETKQNNYYLFSFLLFLLSCLSKATAVVFPIVLLLMEYWAGWDMLKPERYLKKIPFFLCSLLFGAIALSVQSGGDFGGVFALVGEKSEAIGKAFTIWQRIKFASYGFIMYIVKFFVPTGLSAYYPYPTIEDSETGIFMAAPFIVLLTAAGIAYSMVRTKIIGFGMGFYFVTVALVLQFISVGVVLIADRYSYLPHIGLLFLLFCFIQQLIEKNESLKYPIWAGIGVWAMVLAYSTMGQIKIWKDSDALWTSVIIQHPREEQPYSIRGNFYGKTGKIEEAFKDFETALKLGSKRVTVYEGLGNVYGIKGQPQKALEMYSKAIEVNPTKATLYFNRGIAQIGSNPQASIADFTKSIELAPYSEANSKSVRGYAYILVKDYTKAIADLEFAVKNGEAKADVYYHLGIAYTNLENKEVARKNLQEAIRLNPMHEQAKKLLSNL